jgi:hypothetical protein
MEKLYGFWECSDDFNADKFVIYPFHNLEGTEITERHPLVGGWNSIEEAQLEATRLSLNVEIVEE